MKEQQILSIGEAFNGKTPSKDQQRNDGYPILKIRDIDEAGRFRGRFESFVDKEFYERYTRKKLKTGDTIILNAAHNSDYVGSKSALIPTELNGVIATGEWLIVRVKEANSRYVNQYLKSPLGKKSLKNCVKGIHLYPKDVERIFIPLPPLDGQIRIAHLLSKVEGLIAQRKQHLQQLDALLKSVFLEMFGEADEWQTMALSAVAAGGKGTFSNGPFGSDLLTSELTQSGVPVIYIRDIRDAAYRRVSTVCVSAEKAVDLGACQVQPGDILIAKVGDPPGTTAIYPVGEPVGVMTQDVIRLRPNTKIVDARFVTALLNSHIGRRLIRGITVEATRARFGLREFKALEIVVPPLELQEHFGAIAGRVGHLKSCYQRSLNDLETLYGALSQQAFRGGLDLSRVPLPDTLNEGEHVVAGVPSPAAPAIDLPDTDLLLLAVEDRRKLEPLLRNWLAAYRAQLGGVSFSVDRFSDAAQARIAELHPDSDFEMGSDAFEHIKAWVFEALTAGTLMQVFDDEHNCVALKSRPADWGIW
jgi:type I restriction enzyme, S subunit